MHISKNTLWQTSSMNDTKNFPIDWRYLTFDTEIPAQQISAADESSEDLSAQLPLCQDLAIYASPKTWSDSRKRIITWTSCTATVFTGFAAGSYSSGFDQMAQEWKVGDIALSVGITVFTFGIGSAPMFLAPFSEINGRRPVFMIAGGSFVLFQLCCAITHTYWGMIVSRFLTGCASSTFSTVVAGVVSDIYDTEHRNTAMALFSGASLLGSGLGPLVSGFVAMRTTWRWIFYAQVISCGGLMILMMIIFRETRGPVLLSRKAKALNQWYDNLERLGYQCVARHTSNETDGHDDVHRIRWKVRYDEERGSVMRMIKTSICRPVYLLFTEPIVFLFSLWISFSWAVLYATFAAIPLVFRSSHDFNVEQCGAVFGSMCIASILSTILSIQQDRWMCRYLPRSSSACAPERRLYVSCIQSTLLPVGCFWFGWTSSPKDAWILPTLGIGCATMGIFSIYLAVFNYLADIYHDYASSALAAQGFCRNLLRGIFPVIIPTMFNNLTFKGAGSLLAGLGALLTLVPWVLVASPPCPE
jgi:multidrug resistance protein